LGLDVDRKYDRKNYLCFSTKAQFVGHSCEENLKEFSDVGFTWFKGNRLMQTKENGITPGWNFDYSSKDYYFDESRPEESSRLFIKE
jgi:hypothetical protein